MLIKQANQKNAIFVTIGIFLKKAFFNAIKVRVFFEKKLRKKNHLNRHHKN